MLIWGGLAAGFVGLAYLFFGKKEDNNQNGNNSNGDGNSNNSNYEFPKGHHSLLYSDAMSGLKYNNPGNIKLTQVDWDGKVPNAKNKNKEYEEFISLEYGIRAIAKQLLTYQKRGLMSTFQMISTYAPKSDSNNVDAYCNYIMSLHYFRSNDFNKDTSLNLVDISEMETILTGILEYETGLAQVDIDDTKYDEIFEMLDIAKKTALKMLGYE